MGKRGVENKGSRGQGRTEGCDRDREHYRKLPGAERAQWDGPGGTHDGFHLSRGWCGGRRRAWRRGVTWSDLHFPQSILETCLGGGTAWTQLIGRMPE